MTLAASSRDRALLGILCCGLVCLPLLVVSFPPITDLPLLTGQIGLGAQALEVPAGPYKIQWWAPNQLSYLILGASWTLVGPRDAGRLAVILIGILWVSSLHYLSWRRRRSASGAVIASLFVFNHGLYYGFLSFAVGWPVFVMWLAVTAGHKPDSFGRRDALTLLGGSILLYTSHALWLAAGLAWLAVDSLVVRDRSLASLRFAARRLVCVLPLLLVAAFWYPRLAEAGFTSETLWGPSPLARLHPSLWVDAALGGLRGSMEPALLAAIAAWWLLSLWQHRSRLRSLTDWRLLVAAVLLIASSLLLPARFSNTIQFGSRWLPLGLALLALALPPPDLRALLRRGFAVVLMATFCLTTAAAWFTFERRELTGLSGALAALPESQRVVGYDFLHISSVVKGFPFFHMPAYAQLYRGAELHFSFADHATSPVVFKQLPRRIPWLPGQVRKSDLKHYDYALIGGPPDLHASLEAEETLMSRTEHGNWRLYEVRAD